MFVNFETLIDEKDLVVERQGDDLTAYHNKKTYSFSPADVTDTSHVRTFETMSAYCAKRGESVESVIKNFVLRVADEC
ncbi:hypothetical protein [Geovibrio ferrireducens]|uniref:hypothetical protein n=1 Tax=Geovibrio ferrireducens TaxID=46201 RepID=UPI002247FDCD|nr:hypothetical protein [Geovibrio ferrireducens]